MRRGLGEGAAGLGGAAHMQLAADHIRDAAAERGAARRQRHDRRPHGAAPPLPLSGISTAEK
jgi:hypothetical protein